MTIRLVAFSSNTAECLWEEKLTDYLGTSDLIIREITDMYNYPHRKLLFTQCSVRPDVIYSVVNSV